MVGYQAINRLCFFSILIAMLLLATFKSPGMDQDYHLYLFAYQRAQGVLLGDMNFFSLFDIVSKISQAINAGLYGVFLFYAGSAILIKARVMRLQSKNSLLILVLYFLTFFALHEFTQIRAALAVSIVLILHHYSVVRKDPRLYLLGVAIASFVHFSSLVFLLPPILIKLFRKGPFYTAAYLLSTFLIGILISESGFSNVLLAFMGEYVDVYKMSVYLELLGRGEHAKMNYFNFLYLSYLCVAVVLISFQRKILPVKNEPSFESFYYSCFIVGLSLFYVFAFFPVISFRLSEMLISLIPFLLVSFVGLTKSKGWVISFLLIYALIIFSGNVFYNDLIRY